MTPNEFLSAWVDAAINPGEGSCVPEQMNFFIKFLNTQPQIKNILEIGFNGGLSAGIFLSARPDIKLISVDIGDHDYILPAQKLVQKLFPDRFLLVVGDSTLALPQLKGLVEPDLIFIDGAHYAPVVEKDLKNSLEMCKPGTWLLIDDFWPGGESHPDVKKAVDDLVQSGSIVLLGNWAVQGRAWCLAKRIF